MLEDYIIDNRIRYENHYLKVAGTDVEIGGVAGAALLSALIVDTEEGTRRGIAIDSDAERMAWIKQYEREVRRDEWGLIGVEVELWDAPFAQWLLNAAQTETRRQQFLHTNWTDPAQVNALYEGLQRNDDQTNQPTFIFEGEDAEDIYKRYLNWVWTSYQAQIREIPGSQPRAARHRNFVVDQETDWTFLSEEIKQLNGEQQQVLAQWLSNWQKYITRHLKPEKPVLFWEKEVSEKQQKQLTQFLRIQEKEWDYFQCLSAAIYALRLLGYVRRACSVRDITRWMSEQLVKDYTKKNNHDQFVRAWKELGRYSPEVKEYVEELESLGITHFGNKK